MIFSKMYRFRKITTKITHNLPTLSRSGRTKKDFHIPVSKEEVVQVIMIFINFIVLAAGFAALVKSADLFVDGSASLARKFNVSGLIIGLTIVALGTSAPELAVSTTAALRHSNEIALSNVVGSNLFNLLCVLGSCAVFSPVPITPEIIKRDFPFSIIVTVLVLLFSGGLILHGADSQTIGTISRFEGFILLIAFFAYMFLLIQSAKNDPQEDPGNYADISLRKCTVLILAGVALIIAGGQAVVSSAKAIAYFFGMSETLVGLTVVAIGTSLPELVTSIVASRKHENGLAIGNVVGSNIFNIMFILGTTAVLHPLNVTYELSASLVYLILISAVSLFFITTNRELSRKEGAIMILLYVGQLAYKIIG